MRRVLNLLVILLLAVPVRAGDCGSLDALEWLLGDWEQAGDSTITRESWTRVSADTFEGIGETLAADSGERRAYESLRLVAMQSEVFYLAKTGGNARPVAFALSECARNQAVFENPEHDFPRRLEYRLSDQGYLEVAVSDGGRQGFGLTLTRRDDDD